MQTPAFVFFWFVFALALKTSQSVAAWSEFYCSDTEKPWAVISL